MNNPYIPFVRAIERATRDARNVRMNQDVARTASASEADRRGVVLFSPHPDDEAITGLWPLRLRREGGLPVVNVPVTFGSHRARQPARAGELSQACAYLDFSCLDSESIVPRSSFEPLTLEQAVAVLTEFEPCAIFFPHENDSNERHRFTHQLVNRALCRMPDAFSCAVVETEYWGALAKPNVMVEGDADTVADLVAATALHAGEVSRNPYHVNLPAWMQDNVRRGAELMAGAGSTAPPCGFATLYRACRWAHGQFIDTWENGRMVYATERADSVLCD